MKVVLFLICLYSAVKAATWPEQKTVKCAQDTKQKAMYGYMGFNPSLRTSPMVGMSVTVKWDALQYAPYNIKKKGGVYAAYTIKSKSGPSGYFGVQLKKSGQFLFSIWDGDRMSVDREAKKSSQLTWPLDMTHCKRNCQDCGMKHLKATKAKGITTGTQCKYQVKDMKVGDEYQLTLVRTKKTKTIRTKDYGGMPKAHEKIDEKDREITGGVWEVTARNVVTGEMITVGQILFEGDGSGMVRLGTFDEMIGCNGCNMIYHKDTRHSITIKQEDGVTRVPYKMKGKTGAPASICKQYYITGSKEDTSITFEGGPLTKKTFGADGKSHTIW